MNFRIPQIFAVVTLVVFASFANAGERELTRYAIPDHGSIQLMVPKSWRSKISQPSKQRPPVITLSGANANSFQVLITPFLATTPRTASSDHLKIREEIATIAKSLKARVVESNVPIKKLEGPSSIGYYFSVTDKAPKPSEYEFLTQGMVLLGGFDVAFTVLTNNGEEAAVDEALAILAGAEHLPK